MDEGASAGGITHAQLNSISEAVDAAAHEAAGPFPSFTEPTVRGGAAIVTADNDFSLAWLEATVPQLTPWEGAQLRVVGLDSVRPRRAVVLIPGNLESEVILSRVDRRYPQLGAKSWRVYSCSPLAQGRDNRTHLVLGIPERAVRVLRTLGFRLNWGLGKIEVSVTGPSSTVISSSLGGSGSGEPRELQPEAAAIETTGTSGLGSLEAATSGPPGPEETAPTVGTSVPQSDLLASLGPTGPDGASEGEEEQRI